LRKRLGESTALALTESERYYHGMSKDELYQ
jgi:hypothetical protein